MNLLRLLKICLILSIIEIILSLTNFRWFAVGSVVFLILLGILFLSSVIQGLRLKEISILGSKKTFNQSASPKIFWFLTVIQSIFSLLVLGYVIKSGIETYQFTQEASAIKPEITNNIVNNKDSSIISETASSTISKIETASTSTNPLPQIFKTEEQYKQLETLLGPNETAYFLETFQIISDETKTNSKYHVYYGAIPHLYTIREGFIMFGPKKELWVALIHGDFVAYYTANIDERSKNFVVTEVTDWSTQFADKEILPISLGERIPNEKFDLDFYAKTAIPKDTDMGDIQVIQAGKSDSISVVSEYTHYGDILSTLIVGSDHIFSDAESKRLNLLQFLSNAYLRVLHEDLDKFTQTKKHATLYSAYLVHLSNTIDVVSGRLGKKDESPEIALLRVGTQVYELQNPPQVFNSRAKDDVQSCKATLKNKEILWTCFTGLAMDEETQKVTGSQMSETRYSLTGKKLGTREYSE